MRVPVKRRKGTRIYETFRSFCFRNHIPFQGVCSSSVHNLSFEFWLEFDKENEVSIYSLLDRNSRYYFVPELVDLLAVLCNPHYRILDSCYLTDDILNRIRPLHEYEVFRKPFHNCSTSWDLRFEYRYVK